jgi:uncharacterized membrane protein
MDLSKRSALTSARILLAGTWGLFCATILAAPILAFYSCHKTAVCLYFSFSGICHQIPDRSFFLLGHSLPVCHRCSGIYLGLLLGSLIDGRFVQRSRRARRVWIFSACVPMFLDFVLSYSGLWAGTAHTRFFTGMWFGCLMSALLVRGVAEFLANAPWRRLATGSSPLKKGYPWIQKEC